MSNRLHNYGALAAMSPMTTNELWARLRRLFRRRTPSREIERIVSGFRADESPGERRVARRRERLDLGRGWVMEDDEHKVNQVGSGLQHRRSGRAGSKKR